MPQDILVSVLMTSYNRENFVAEAIKSVLASTYTNFEFIICDDCSVDKTFEIEKKFAAADNRIKLYRNEKNLGDFPNRDKAASYASGKYLKYVDSDDIIEPHGLQIMLDAMHAFPEAVLGISQLYDTNNAHTYPELISAERAYQEHYFGFGTLSYGPIAAIIEKKILLEMGGFGTNRFVGDTELWLKITAKYPLVKIEPNVVEWRKHEGQEFLYGMKHDFFIQKAYVVYMASLNAPNCPLTKEDISIIIKRLQWKHARDILSIAFKKVKPARAAKIFKQADFGVWQLLMGALPYKLIKNKFYKSLQ